MVDPVLRLRSLVRIDGKGFRLMGQEPASVMLRLLGSTSRAEADHLNGTGDYKALMLEASRTSPDGRLKWTFATGGSIFYSSPAQAADGTVYVGSSDAAFYAIGVDGGKKWSIKTGASISHPSPVIGPDGTVYFGAGTDMWIHKPANPCPLASLSS